MNISIHKWDKQKYIDPQNVLIQLRDLETSQPVLALPSKIRTLRTNTLKKQREGREGALFCFGLGKVLGTKVHLTRLEDEDYDIVTLWRDGDTLVYTPVQLKEVTPDSVNATSTLQSEIDKLSKYPDSRNLVVAIHLNKRMTIDFSEIRVPTLTIAELWVFGALNQDQSRWFIYGDMLSAPRFFEFDYPRAA